MDRIRVIDCSIWEYALLNLPSLQAHKIFWERVRTCLIHSPFLSKLDWNDVN
jgi:hypothetical protein